ncbi:MAG: TonB family protein [Campylobacterales bacterium]|nr:TonB family protein [Campylobacterales bacterium]
MLNKPEIEKKEEVTPKQTIEPKPIVKVKLVVKKEPIVQSIIKPYNEPQKIVQNERDANSQENLIAQKEKQETKSKIIQDELTLYLSKIRAKIQENLNYPPLAKRLKLEGESIVAFTILSDGSVKELSIEIKNSSGYTSLDRQAINTILSVSPFDVPPQNNMSIVLPIAFKLNL